MKTSTASRKKSPKSGAALPTLNPHAAGIDIGAREIFVALPPQSDPKPVRRFSTFTDDLLALRDWLRQCGVSTVAMESTGVYWIPLFQILEAAGIEVCLVNARHVKNLPGRKSDIADCQWLQYLHSVGLLRGSFRPPEAICAVRSLLRHRERLLRCAADQVRLMHKALTQMNVQVQHVISDLTGLTGLAIVQAILEGERGPVALAKLKDHRIKASRDTIARSLRGDWRQEHLFTLRQSFETWSHYQRQIQECAEQVQRGLQNLEERADVASMPPVRGSKKKQRNEPAFDVRAQLYPVLGLDLTQMPAMGNNTVLTVLSELGPDFAQKFRSAKAFSSWLGVCPDNRISGGKILSVATRDVKSRVAAALRLAAQGLWNAQNYFGELYRRWQGRLGRPKAVTAMAHKLARILWHLCKYKEAFDPEVFREEEEKMKRKKLARLHNSAAALGLKLVPA
jgi:transposase